MTYGSSRRSNVFHLPPAAPRAPAFVPNQALIETYWMHAGDYLFACLTGATPNIIIERAERMFLAREALRKRGISV